MVPFKLEKDNIYFQIARFYCKLSINYMSTSTGLCFANGKNLSMISVVRIFM